MFVTADSFNVGSLNVDGANGKCMAAAAAATPPLAGVFRAWLANADGSAQLQLGNARGWVRIDSVPFVDRISDLIGGQILYPPRIDENGVDHPDDTVSVATAAAGNGVLVSDCNHFTNTGMMTIGRPDATADDWTDLMSLPCPNNFHLYCFGVDHISPLPALPVIGKRAFVTASPFAISPGGIGDADMLCGREANAAHLQGTFVALLATTTASAASRVGSGPWVRMDGVSLGDNLAAPLAPLNVQANGGYSFGTVWTGAPLPSSTGVDASTCNDWKVDSSGLQGSSTRSNGQHFYDEGASAQCSSGRPIRCFEL